MKPVLALILSEDQMKVFAEWLDQQYQARINREAKPDTDPTEQKELLIDCAIEEVCQNLGVEGYEFS